MVLQQARVDDTNGFIEDLELLPEAHFIDSELVFPVDTGWDFLLEEIDRRIHALDIAQVLIVLFLLILGDIHAGVEAGEALHDLRPREKSDALGVAEHDILREVRSVILAKVELIKHPLPAGLLILFLKHLWKNILFDT